LLALKVTPPHLPLNKGRLGGVNLNPLLKKYFGDSAIILKEKN